MKIEFELFSWTICLIFTGAAAYFDHRTGRIPNYLTYPLIATGIIITILRGDILSIIISMIVLLAGPLFKGIGMGDIKYLSGIQLWIGKTNGYPIILLIAIPSFIIMAIINRLTKKISHRMGIYFLISIIILFILHNTFI